MAPSTITAWRERFRFSKNELVKRTGLAKTTIYRVDEEGIASAGTLIRIANAFGISVSELLAGPPGFRNKTKAPAVRTVSLYEGVPAMGFEGIVSIEKLEILDAQITDPAMVAVVINSNQMFPTLTPGDVVLVNPSEKAPVDGAIVCLIDQLGGIGMVLRCRRSAGGLVFAGDNPMFPRLTAEESARVEIVGTVERIVDRDLRQERVGPGTANVSAEH